MVLDPERLQLLEMEGVEALVVAFVGGGVGNVEGSIPEWEDATKGLQGQVGAGGCVGHCGRECVFWRTQRGSEMT